MHEHHHHCGHHRDARFMWEGRERGRGGRDRHDGFGRGRGRSERPFEQGDLRWLALDLIATQPRHGYEIIKEIEDMFSGQYSPSPGIIYPTLTYLEETGLVASDAQASKKLYSLTEEGKASLTENHEAVEAVRARVEAFRIRVGGPPAPEMMRAMENLGSALRHRLKGRPASEDNIRVIVAAIDAAAKAVEEA